MPVMVRNFSRRTAQVKSLVVSVSVIGTVFGVYVTARQHRSYNRRLVLGARNSGISARSDTQNPVTGLDL